jgi:hypothetical protein
MSGLRSRIRSIARPGEDGPAWGDGDPRVAVITMVRDEGAVLPLWLRHYGAQVGLDNLYVVDDNSSDGSTDDLPCDVLKVPGVRDGKFEPSRMRLISGVADGLLGLYDAVVFCDADEFIVPDPARHKGLVDFVASRAGAEAVGVQGYNVIQHVGAEAPLDLGAPILAQRSYAVFVPTMCKPSISYTGAAWVAASHGIRAEYKVDPELFMFHLKFADRDQLHVAAEKRRQMVELDGRARATSWRRGGDELVELLETVSGRIDPAATPELTAPGGRALARLVIEDPDRQGAWRARKGGQVKAMEEAVPLRIPERLRGSF